MTCCSMIFTGKVRKVRDANKTGLSSGSEYKIWAGIRSRCNPRTGMGSNKYYSGVKISQAWADSYSQFEKDMGLRPGKDYSVDRIDNSQGYCKHNCRWATKFEQSMNRRNSVKHGLPLGVTKRNGHYSVRISVLGRSLHLGTFATRNRAVSEYERFSKYFSRLDIDLL